MSERDDIETAANNGDNKTVKNGFFDKIKQGVSTDDTSSETSDNAISEDGLIDGNVNPFKGVFNIFKRNEKNDTPTVTSVPAQETPLEKNLSEETNILSQQPEQIPEKPEFDPEEEAEFQMISAFLDKEPVNSDVRPTADLSESTVGSDEYVSKTEKIITINENKNGNEQGQTSELSDKDEDKNNITQGTEETEKTETSVSLTDTDEPKNIDWEKEVAETVVEYDVQDAFENEEAIFDVGDALENEDAEFVMIDIDDDEDFIDDIDDIDELSTSDSNKQNQKDESITSSSSLETKEEIKEKISPETSAENETKSKSDDISTKDDGIKVENIDSDLIEIDEDEDFHFEEDFVFDESDDESEETSKPDNSNDFNTIEKFFDKQPDNTPTQTEIVTPTPLNNNNLTVADTPQEIKSENVEQSSAEEFFQQNPSASTTEENSPQTNPPPALVPDETKKKKTALDKFKLACEKTKHKLIDLWNTPEEETSPAQSTTTVQPTNSAVLPDVQKSDNTENTENTNSESNQQTAVSPQQVKTQDTPSVDSEPPVDSSQYDKPKVVPMTVIKTETRSSTTELDREKMLQSLNVIEGDKNSGTPELLTPEQKHQHELNQNVLEKVKVLEEQMAERREEQRKIRAEQSERAYEKAFHTSEPIAEIEINDYILPNSQEYIKVKAGRFSESVKAEYEFYVGYNRLKNVAQQQTAAAKARADSKLKNSAKNSDNEKLYEEFSEHSFAKSRDKLEYFTVRMDNRDQKHPETLEYRKEDDAPRIREHLKNQLKSNKLQWYISFMLTLLMFILICFKGKLGVGMGETADNSNLRIFAVFNMFIYGASLFINRNFITRGLSALKKLKSNSDTGVAAAAAVTMLQSVFAIFSPYSYLGQGLTIYTILVMLALTVNAYGSYVNADRISRNFRFVSDSSQKYTGKFFHDQRMVATLLSGTRNDKSELVFQKKTSFLKHFIKLSNIPDPGEDLADKFALPAIAFSLLMGIISIFTAKNFFYAISVTSVMMCTSLPFCAKALGAVSVRKLAKSSLINQSMVVGYQAIESFSESAAVMLDAKDLYPEGSVHMNGLKRFNENRIDDAVLAAASVILEAGGAMAGMFDGIIEGDKTENLPQAENVIYEDGKGLLGFVNGERVFIGNRQLLRDHGITPKSKDYEAEQRGEDNEILYLVYGGELVGMFIVSYSGNRRVADTLQRMEANGMSLLIRTTDVNVTAERIAKDFGLSYRSIKVLEQKNSNVIRDEMIGKERASSAFVATKGGVTSFGRAVSGCIQTKRDISLSLALQIVGTLVILVTVTALVLVSGIHSLGALPLFICCLIWTLVVLFAPGLAERIIKKLNK